MTRTAPPLIIAAFSLVIAVAIALLVPSPARAHSELIDVQPAVDTVVAEGTEITLTFSTALIEIGSEAVVTDALNAVHVVPVVLPTRETASFTMPSLAEGAVQVAWRVVAADGHPISGSLTYVAEEPPSPRPSPSTSPEPVTATPPAATATPVATPQASVPEERPEEAPEGQGVPVVVWIAGAAALMAAFAVTLAARRR